MDEGGSEAVVVEGDLSLTRPLTVTKPLYVSGSLAMPEGAQLTVDGTIFCVNGDLTCDSVAVQNGAMAEFICAWRGHGRRGEPERERRLLGSTPATAIWSLRA